MEVRHNKLIIEEVKATKLFLWLFYIIFIAYDVFYYYILPRLTDKRELGLPEEGIGHWIHIIVIGFLPVAHYLLKSRNPYVVKYLLFFGYNILDLISGLMLYVGNDVEFESGNVVELFSILFTSLFMSKKFFWSVYGTIVFKYVVYGIVLHDAYLLLGIVILTVLAGISFLFLSRFHSYINTLEKVNEEIKEKEKLALVGQMAASIGHEIRNPLASLKGFTQLKQEKYPNDQEYYKIMENEIERINIIVNDLMYIGKPKSLVVNKHDINKVLHYVVSILNQIAQSNNINIHVNVLKLPKVDCDSNKLKQVFLNLLKNAIESMPTGGNINISSKVIENEQIVILIEDEGQGIDEEKISMLGQPFFTSKQDGNGLGLMVSFDIIKQHKGRLVYNSVAGKGTIVEVYLPIE